MKFFLLVSLQNYEVSVWFWIKTAVLISKPSQQYISANIKSAIDEQAGTKPVAVDSGNFKAKLSPSSYHITGTHSVTRIFAVNV